VSNSQILRPPLAFTATILPDSELAYTTPSTTAADVSTRPCVSNFQASFSGSFNRALLIPTRFGLPPCMGQSVVGFCFGSDAVDSSFAISDWEAEGELSFASGVIDWPGFAGAQQ